MHFDDSVPLKTCVNVNEVPSENVPLLVSLAEEKSTIERIISGFKHDHRSFLKR